MYSELKIITPQKEENAILAVSTTWRIHLWEGMLIVFQFLEKFWKRVGLGNTLVLSKFVLL